MPYEYLASVQSAVRRINDRLKSISNKLGSESQLLQNFESLIDVALKDNTRFKGNLLQIHTPSDIFNDPEKMEALKKIEDAIPTWQDIKKQYEPAYEKYKESDDVQFLDEAPDIETFIDVHVNLPQALVYMYPVVNDDLQKAVEIMHIKGRRKTYEELNDAIDYATKGRQKATTQRAEEKRYGLTRPRHPRVNL
jgi:hypothetical protein